VPGGLRTGLGDGKTEGGAGGRASLAVRALKGWDAALGRIGLG
jgi:hypothetical protein